MGVIRSFIDWAASKINLEEYYPNMTKGLVRFFEKNLPFLMVYEP